MITKIGIVSGEILMLLDRNARPLSLGDIESRSEESRDLILMSLGWLIREGYIYSEYRDGLLVVSRVIKNSVSALEESSMEMLGV